MKKLLLIALPFIFIGWGTAAFFSRDYTPGVRLPGEVLITPRPSATKIISQPPISPSNTPKISANSTPKATPKSTGSLIGPTGVPFFAQAPQGHWSDQRQQDGCEEASVMMAVYWARGQTISGLANIEAKIIEISDWEETVYGGYHDTSPRDTVDRIMDNYFKFSNYLIIENATIEEIKSELNRERVVLAQFDGRILANPNYTPPGPINHMLAIIGYDESTREFITNDPGTRQGKNFRYDEYVLYEALRDYPTGHYEPNPTVTKTIISVGKE